MTVHPASGPVARLLWLAIDAVRSPVVLEGTASVCDWNHGPFFGYLDDPTPIRLPRGPVHIDIEAKAHNRSQQVVTLIGIKRASAGGQQLAAFEKAHRFKDTTLEPGGPRETLHWSVGPIDGGKLAAGPGDAVEVRLRMTRGGRSPRGRFTIPETKTT